MLNYVFMISVPAHSRLTLEFFFRYANRPRNSPVPTLLFWLYLLNAILLINHEIDSAFWKEWELFRLPGGIGGFLLLHFPLLFIVLYGLVLVTRQSPAGLIFSLVLSLAGIFAFSIHTWFLKKGRPQFDAPMSKFILTATLVVSVVQLIVTVCSVRM